MNFESANRDPEVARRAPYELEDAGAALRSAERTWREEKNPEETAHFSYVAEQKVALARVEADLREYKAQQTRRGLVLTVDDVLFETGRTELKPGALVNMEPLVAFLQANPDFRVAIEGHTDSTGGAGYNEQLSRARAGSVASYLMAQGVSPGQILTYGYGERYPIASNVTPLGKQQNRRVELVVFHRDSPYRQPVAVVVPAP